MFDKESTHALDNINWSFPGNNSTTRASRGLFDARALHWYPATYIPEIPYTLIELLSRRGDKILDPFAGIGTTLWQAQSLGREAFGCELTVVGFSICKDIWTLTSRDVDLSAAQEEVLDALHRWGQSDATSQFLSTPRGELLEPWFSAGTLRELAYLADQETMMQTDASFSLLRLSTSAILASVSEQRRGWGCIADNMRPKPSDMAAAPETRGAIDKVIQRVRSTVRSIAGVQSRLSFGELSPILSNEIDDHLFEGDCRQSEALRRHNFYDLVVTSPPYPAMVDYSTAQRLSYYWHGVVPEENVAQEIGARRRRFAAGSLADYLREMEEALTGIASSMKRGGLLAMVVPEFSTTGADDPRTSVMREAIAEATGSTLRLRWEKDRVLPANRRHINQKWTSLRKEQIKVYERIR